MREKSQWYRKYKGGGKHMSLPEIQGREIYFGKLPDYEYWDNQLQYWHSKKPQNSPEISNFQRKAKSTLDVLERKGCNINFILNCFNEHLFKKDIPEIPKGLEYIRKGKSHWKRNLKVLEKAKQSIKELEEVSDYVWRPVCTLKFLRIGKRKMPCTIKDGTAGGKEPRECIRQIDSLIKRIKGWRLDCKKSIFGKYPEVKTNQTIFFVGIHIQSVTGNLEYDNIAKLMNAALDVFHMTGEHIRSRFRTIEKHRQFDELMNRALISIRFANQIK